MGYRLKNGVFSVRCRHHGCPFNTQIKIESNLMGSTKKDVELEAIKIARDMATTKHDAVYGTNHYLDDPVIRKVGGSYEPFGARADSAQARALPGQVFAGRTPPFKKRLP